MARQLDAISVLEEDHRRVRKLFSQMKTAADDGSPREDLVDKVIEELRVHTQLEEEIFYPAFHEAAAKSKDEHLYYEAVEEHHVVDLVSPEIEEEASGTMTYSAKVKVLYDIVEHHLAEEEGDMFPRARKLCSQETLAELGDKILARKQEILGGEGAIDLNSATAEQLTRIVGIDTARAQHIVEYRDRHGGFSDWNDLYGVQGIDEAMVERLQDESRLGG